jgi:acetyltransferase-like isoleucine patch superfamily enzyme
MVEPVMPDRPSRPVIAWRILWTLLEIVVEQVIVCGLALVPVSVIWMTVAARLPDGTLVRAVVFSLMLVPSYIAWVLCLMTLSGLATRLTGTMTAPDLELPLAAMSWDLMTWARCVVRIHLVRLFAGTVFRGSPIWTAYLRLNGAHIGRRVYINTVNISDHNLLEFGDDVVIGGDVHLSGHTVEAGVLKTGRVRLGRCVTIGLGSVIEIGVEVGEHAQVGALSFVPKHTTLPGHGVYAGIPVKRLE